jgi:hypothetical protein
MKSSHPFRVPRSHRYVIRWRTAAGGPFFWYQASLTQALIAARRLSGTASYEVVDHHTERELEWQVWAPEASAAR